MWLKRQEWPDYEFSWNSGQEFEFHNLANGMMESTQRE